MDMLTDLIYYDLKVAALIAVFYLFYMLLLARETTHTLNRLVLLTGIGLSAILPLTIITFHRTVVVESGLRPVAEDSAVGNAAAMPAIETLGWDFDWTVPLAAVLLIGTIVRLSYVALSYKRLKRLMHSGERHALPSGTHVCVVDAPIAPFSWMHTVVLPRADYPEGHGEAPVLAHEEAHVRHRHSYDVVVVELLTALQWFNPVVWFLRQELRVVHEYEADASVLSSGFSESQYIHLLMQKATGIQACALANGIRTHKTKKRILMMLKPKSKHTAWLKALYVVPIVLVSLAMTAKTVVDYETTEENNAVSIFHENTNGRGESYQIRHTPSVKFYNNGKEEAIGDRPIALEVKKTTMQLDGVKFDENSLPTLPVSALHEIHLDETSPDHFVCRLVSAKVGAGPVPARNYSPKMSDTEFALYVKQQQAAGIDEKELNQMMLNEGSGISRAHILHIIRAYGSNKNKFFVVDGKEVSREDYIQLQPENIASVTVMDVGPAKKTFGEKGRYGATIIETKQATSDTHQQDDPVFDVCEQMPSFPGGEGKLMEFIARNIKYPEAATKSGVQGRVMVQFIVEKDGSLTNAKVLENPKKSAVNMVVVTAYMPDKQRQDAEAHNAGVQALRDEALRVINAMPRWTPGKQKGKPVRSKFVLPVTYRLN